MAEAQKQSFMCRFGGRTVVSQESAACQRWTGLSLLSGSDKKRIFTGYKWCMLVHVPISVCSAEVTVK